MIPFATRSAAVLLVLLALAACGGASQVSSEPAEPSVAPSQTDQAPASAAPSDAAPSEASTPSACLESDILAAVDSYMDGEIPEEPTMNEVADALAALELDGRAAEFRDDVVAAFRGETGETLDEMKLHDALFSLIPLQSEVNLVEC
ncbi:MAG: hypothetical protein M3Y40_10840 [Chloroflexota bacterium]|nr:hypothetical protein [Chloroflexota bacterium]